jgi:hypothetical protein
MDFSSLWLSLRLAFGHLNLVQLLCLAFGDDFLFFSLCDLLRFRTIHDTRALTLFDVSRYKRISSFNSVEGKWTVPSRGLQEYVD